MKNYSKDPNRQYHIQVAPGEIGRYVLLPGDPGRVEAIAAHLDGAHEVARNREYLTYTGTLDGTAVSVCSTGIGGASASIAVQELHACGADTFIRVGTCGGMQEHVMSGDVVIANAAVRAEGTSREIAPVEYPAVSDFFLTASLVDSAYREQDERGIAFHVGVVQAKEWFYGQHDPASQAASAELLAKWEAWKRMGCLASEMESAAIFILAQQLRCRAGACFSVVANQEREAARLPNPVNHDVEAAIRVAIGAVRSTIAADAAARDADEPSWDAGIDAVDAFETDGAEADDEADRIAEDARIRESAIVSRAIHGSDGAATSPAASIWERVQERLDAAHASDPITPRPKNDDTDDQKGFAMTMTREEMLSYVDHTLLSPTATWSEIEQVIDDGIAYGCASVCIPPAYVADAYRHAAGNIPICTVIGFPNGYNTTKVKVAETKDAIANGAAEVDMVVNLGWVKDRRWTDIANEIDDIVAAAREAAGERGVIVKVIIETGVLTDDEKVALCHVVSGSDADYIKTSTGFNGGGATKEDVQLMCDNMDCGKKVKASGGISDFLDAEAFLEIGADRLGTSRLVGIAKQQEGELQGEWADA